MIVGARCAGAATAMLMARAGLRVLVLDRVHPSRDTLSTHALMRAGVLQLSRWGLLERIVAAGTPPVTGTTFHYGDGAETVELARPLYAPRRTVLDTACWSAAAGGRRAGPVRGGRRRAVPGRTGRVTGVLARVRGGDAGAASAHRSRSAPTGCARRWPGWSAHRRSRRAPRRARSCTATGRVRRRSHYDWFYRPGVSAGDHPDQRRPGLRLGRAARRTLRRRAPGAASPELFAACWPRPRPRPRAGRRRERAGPLRGFPGVPGYLRRAIGPGLGAGR